MVLCIMLQVDAYTAYYLPSIHQPLRRSVIIILSKWKFVIIYCHWRRRALQTVNGNEPKECECHTRYISVASNDDGGSSFAQFSRTRAGSRFYIWRIRMKCAVLLVVVLYLHLNVRCILCRFVSGARGFFFIRIQ